MDRKEGRKEQIERHKQNESKQYSMHTKKENADAKWKE